MGSWNRGHPGGRLYDQSAEEKTCSPTGLKRVRVADKSDWVTFWSKAWAGSCGVCKWRSIASLSRGRGFLSKSPHLCANWFLAAWLSSLFWRWCSWHAVIWLKCAWPTMSNVGFPRSSWVIRQAWQPLDALKRLTDASMFPWGRSAVRDPTPLKNRLILSQRSKSIIP